MVEPDPQLYATALLGEEGGEIAQIVGKAGRFGLDAPGPDRAPYFGKTARQLLAIEAGDMLAAIRYGALAGLLDMTQVEAFAARKLAKLLDPDSRDCNGYRLAPDPKGGR
jgi:hypothetical protein